MNRPSKKAGKQIENDLFRLANDIEKRKGHIPAKSDDWLGLFVTKLRKIAHKIKNIEDIDLMRQEILMMPDDPVLTYAQTAFLIFYHQNCRKNQVGPYSKGNTT